MAELLAIQATIDFVFKLLFGDVKNIDLLIDLLNAVLRPKKPIVGVVILNPFNLKRFAAGKVSIVDIKAWDSSGHWYVIEVQTTLQAGLRNRLVYYLSGMYHSQMLEPDGYNDLRPAICICFLTESLFPKRTIGHSCFELYDRKHGISFGNQLQLHLVELSKYNLDEESIRRASRFEQWVFFLLRAHLYTEARLRELLPAAIFQKAIGVLVMISRNPKLRIQYDDRIKADLDQRSALKDARTEGRTEGEEIGEKRGETRGKLIGKVLTLEQILELPKSDGAKLSKLKLDELEKLANKLQRQVSKRK